MSKNVLLLYLQNSFIAILIPFDMLLTYDSLKLIYFWHFFCDGKPLSLLRHQRQVPDTVTKSDGVGALAPTAPALMMTLDIRINVSIQKSIRNN